MGENSSIEWCDHTLNFWIGCQEVSPACDFCYAREQNSFRNWVKGWGPHGERRATKTWKDLAKWNRAAAKAGTRYRVFINSLSDFFDNKADPAWRAAAWKMFRDCTFLDILLLTKRPQNIAEMLPADWGAKGYPNVWIGCTVENQEEANRRLPILLAIAAAVHFISAEPLLGDLDLCEIPYPADGTCSSCDTPITLNAYTGNLNCESACDGPSIHALDWVIVGGESHKDPAKRRRMDLQHARDIRDACIAYGVAFFGKQDNKVTPLPPDLLIREFPKAA